MKKLVRSALLRVPRLYDALTGQHCYRLYYRLWVVREREFRCLRRLVETRTPSILDVGGGNGQSILSTKGLFPNAIVHTFEPNLAHRDDLSRLAKAFPDVHYHSFALGSQVGEFTRYWPNYNGKRMLGLASPSRGEATSWLSQATVFGFDPALPSVEGSTCLVKRLDDLDLRLDVIKIDTQGNRGSSTAGRDRNGQMNLPVILAEGVKPGDDTWLY